MSRKTINFDLLKENLAQITVDDSAVRVPGEIGRNNLEEDLHLAAAVLVTFDPEQLRPFEPVDATEARGPAVRRLLANATLRYDDQGRPSWSLKHGARRRALQRLGSRERILAALELAQERPQDGLQATLEAAVHGTAKPLDRQSLTELRNTLQVIDWLRDTELAGDLPAVTDVRERIDWEELMQPFRYLVKDGFYGRYVTLGELQEHVDAEIDPAPLLIYGPGGVGKSTLLSEFILRQTDRHGLEERLPFSYIDFDQARIDPYEPLTILMTAADQLSVQFAAQANQFSEFVEEWSYRLSAEVIRGDQNIYESLKIVPTAIKGDIRRGQSQQTERYIDDFAVIYEQMPTGSRPWLLVLDTFEEVQLSSYDLVAAIDGFLEALRRRLPGVRVLIAGRSSAEEASFTSEELEGFDEAASLAFLQRQNVTNPDVARQIFQAVTGNPLSLKLAARVVRDENLADNADSAALRDVLRKVSEGNIQGQLYRRVLDHITDPNVCKLAHPGLTLRLITPDLILKVLAGPCGVEVRDEADAQRLFDLLSQEVTLVAPAGPGMLRHRPDIRAVMIAALHDDKPLVVHDIHEAAIAYYSQQDSAEARAEEIYHRLFVEPDFSVIESRWEPRYHETLERLLRPAIYELTPRARAWLAARLRLTGIEDVDWDETDLPEWENHTEKRVHDLIRSNDWQGALTLLGGRPERMPGSPLYLLETTILRQQERWKEARRSAYEGIRSMRTIDNFGGLFDLLRQAIAIDIQLGNYEQAGNELARARDLLAEADQVFAEAAVNLELDLFDLKIIHEQPGKTAEKIALLRQQVRERFLKLDDQDLLRQPALIRDTLAEMGSQDGDVLSKGLRLMTFGELSETRREALARSINTWDLALSQSLNEPPGFLLRQVEPSLSFDEGWQTYFRTTRSSRITRDVEQLLKRYGHVAIGASDISFEADEDMAKGIEPGAKEYQATGFDVIGGDVVGSIII
ncbi:MAG: ATP-binding protein [Candidatus Promineifilaceae bacterium]